jgi:hypothetical protein
MSVEVSGLQLRRDRDDIIYELQRSAERGNVLGIFIEGQDEMITTSVSHIDCKLIHFQKTDLHGYPVQENPVSLEKIKSVIRFNTLFTDPVYERIRQRKSSDNRAA